MPCEEAECLPAQDAVTHSVPRCIVPHVLKPLDQATKNLVVLLIHQKSSTINGIVMRNEITIHISTSLVGIIRNEHTEKTMHFTRQRDSDVIIRLGLRILNKEWSNLHYLARQGDISFLRRFLAPRAAQVIRVMKYLMSVCLSG